MAEAFEENLPLNGWVTVNWKKSKDREAFKEPGVYRGYEGDNHRRCKVEINGTIVWVDRAIISEAE